MGYYDDVRDGLIPEDSPIHEQVKQFEKGIQGQLNDINSNQGFRPSFLFGGGDSLGTEPFGMPLLFTIETESGTTTLSPKHVIAYTHEPIDEEPYRNCLSVDIHMVSGTIFTAKMDAVTWNNWRTLRIGE
tara:strand:+ start:235 stop:624 length:390 start_codon:yes stop_codon:yes gene_type:complete